MGPVWDPAFTLAGQTPRLARMRRAIQGRRLHHPGTVPGVLVGPAIRPGPDGLGYHLSGHDVVLDSPGAQPLLAARQVMRLTRLSPAAAKNLVESAPVTVLWVPDLLMAEAARDVLRLSGAIASITDPRS
jgi:hypothetical protein